MCRISSLRLKVPNKPLKRKSNFGRFYSYIYTSYIHILYSSMLFELYSIGRYVWCVVVMIIGDVRERLSFLELSLLRFLFQEIND